MSIRNIIPASRLFVVESLGTTTADKIFDADSPHCKVLRVWGVMTANGASTDTVKVDDGTSDIATAVDVSAKSAKDTVVFVAIDTAKTVLVKDSTLTVTRVSAAPADIFILCQLLTE